MSRSSWMRGAGAFGAVGLLAASLVRGEGIVPFAAADHPFLALGCLAAGIVLVVLGPTRSTLEAWIYGSSRLAFDTALFLAASATGALVSLLLFEGVPRLDDGVAALFQARIFATGRTVLPLPEHAEFFEQFGVIGGRAGLGWWCGMYPPGWPAVLALGVIAGAPWLVNPLLGGALAVAIVEGGNELYDRRTGRTAGLFVLFSPMAVLLAATHLSHTLTALAATVSLWGVSRLIRTGRIGAGMAAGASLGVALLARPFSALVLGIVYGAGALAAGRRLLAAWRGAFAATLSVLAAVLVLLAFQERTTGDRWTAGHEIAMGTWGRFGFVDIGVHHRHTPERGVELSLLRLRSLNERLLGWPVPSLLLPLAVFLLGRARPTDLWMIAPLLALLGTYSAYWYYEAEFPGRYLFCGLPMLFVLAARGWHASIARFGDVRWRRALQGLGAGGCLFAAFGSAPALFADYTPSFGDVEDVLPRVVADYGIRHAIVFLDAVGSEDVRGLGANDRYGTGFLRNRLDLAGDVIYARNLRERNLVLMREHPDRDFYLYRFHRPTGRAQLYRLVPSGDRFEPIEVPARTPDLLGYGDAPPVAAPPVSRERRRLVVQPPYVRAR